MDLRFYLPISNSLRPIDAQPEKISPKDCFIFSLSCQNSNPVTFSVYKSLASFLSFNAFHQLSFKQNTLTIIYQSIQLTSQEVANELIHLLSGKPIIINQNNFEVFQEIFNQLGNNDFELYFNKQVPESPKDFYLSIHSLKDISCRIYELEPYKLHYDKSSCFMVPTGIRHLFFPTESSNFASNKKKITLNQFQDGVKFFKRFSKGYFCLPTSNQMKFITYYQFNPPLFEAYFLFFFPGSTTISVPIDEYEEDQKRIISLENSVSDLSFEFSQAQKFINQQAEELFAKEEFIQQEILNKKEQENTFKNELVSLKINYEEELKKLVQQKKLCKKRQKEEFENQINALKKSMKTKLRSANKRKKEKKKNSFNKKNFAKSNKETNLITKLKHSNKKLNN
jgi:hypothetical protein